MRAGERSERGLALVAVAAWLGAIVALAAIAIEVARLTTAATEVQVASDSAALAAAVALARGASTSGAQAAGRSAAAANFVDGLAVDSSGVQIDIGHYDPAPSADPHFSATCTPGACAGGCNAARATVTVSGVQYVMANILNGQTATDVTKNAVADAECLGSGYAQLPIAVCQQAFQQIPGDQLCGPGSGTFVMNPTTGQNACWSSLTLTTNPNRNDFLSLFPPECGGTQQLELFPQDSLSLQNGVDANVWKTLECCVACKGKHDFTVPVVGDCATLNSTNCNTSLPLLGFASIHIDQPTDVNPPGAGGGQTDCGNFFPGCSQTFSNPVGTAISATQAFRSDLPGKPGSSSCINLGSTAVVLGQLP